MEIVASKQMHKYFAHLRKEIDHSYDIAKAARKKGVDPHDDVEIMLANSMAERVIGLISIVAPNVMGVGIPERIEELEKEYGLLDWRVGFIISEEVAKQKFCKFPTKLEAMEVGIRMGFAYLTLGIVAAPLEGFVGLKTKKRKDGKEYFALQYAGPVRGAGGTASSVSVILADYVRVKMGYAPWDPTEQEVNRYVGEVNDYHERITNLQYRPSNEELQFMVSHLPIEVDGDPTERIEVSNYKDCPRIDTNLIRGGMCLVIAEGLCQKTPKLWKRLSKWGKDFDLEWGFMADFLKLKEEIHAKHSAGDEGAAKGDGPVKEVLRPNDTFVADIVAGRPVLTHPMAVGGLRLRYGRCRNTGFSAAAMNPASLQVLERFIAIGTQLKVERPGKAASIVLCDTIDGPIVKLKDGTVKYLATEAEAIAVVKEVKEVLFVGDILFNYGDFSENGHKLVPAGYCPEWWALEVVKAINISLGKDIDTKLDYEKISSELSVDKKSLENAIEKPLYSSVLLLESFALSDKYSVPLHPTYTNYWKVLSILELEDLVKYLSLGKIKRQDKNGKKIVEKIVLPLFSSEQIHSKGKRLLELSGVSHIVVAGENVVIGSNEAQVLLRVFGINSQEELSKLVIEKSIASECENVLEYLNKLGNILLRDKCGTFIGARMGRPEKAKMRHMKGKPHGLFPVGEEGGRMKSFQAALESGGIIKSQFNKEWLMKLQNDYGDIFEMKDNRADDYAYGELNIKEYFKRVLNEQKMRVYPDLIKGVAKVSNKAKIPENIAKAIYRAKYQIAVNKDGTTRYDCSELPLTHFKPKEIGTSIAKLKEIGYLVDIHGAELVDNNQICEMKPQDLVLPGYDSIEESSSKVLIRVTKFIDEILVKLYKVKAFYNCEKEEDLVGHLVIGLAPHISAGTVGRIIGFSQTQSLLAHPMYHAGLRRDCLSKDTIIPIFNGLCWENITIEEFVKRFEVKKIVDDFGSKVAKVKGYKTFSYNKKSQKLEITPIAEVSTHKPSEIIKIDIENGRSIKTTLDHKFLLKDGTLKEASSLQKGDKLISPFFQKTISKDIKHINLIDTFINRDNLMVREINKEVQKKILNKTLFRKRHNINKSELDNYLLRDSFPLIFLNNTKIKVSTDKAKVALRRDNTCLPNKIEVNEKFLYIVGIYIAEGYARVNNSKKGFAQIQIAATEEEIRQKIITNMLDVFQLAPSRVTPEAIIYSSKLLYELFVEKLGLGSTAHTKRIPSKFLNLPLKKLKFLLQGYYDGDGSTDSKELSVSCDSVSEKLLSDILFALSRFRIYARKYTYTKKPGPKVAQFYIKKNKKVPMFTITKLTIPSNFCTIFALEIGFSLKRKQKVLESNLSRKITGTRIDHDDTFAYLAVKNIKKLNIREETYCLNVSKNHNFIANNILVKNCDGDEAAVMMLMDGLLNFSKQYLPSSRGSTMDCSLVLTPVLTPAEVDDQVLGIDVLWTYPLELYEAALEMKKPWEVKVGIEGKKILQLNDRLGSELQYEDFGYTHNVDNFNKGIQCSAYKTLPSMREKLFGQMEIASKVRAVDMDMVASLVIRKHFLADIKGNFRKFSMQGFRCSTCNTKYRRPPISGQCSGCTKGNIIFTISQGSVVKYMQMSLDLCEQYDFSPYLKETIFMLKTNIDVVFGREKDKQVGLGEFMG